MTKLEELRLAYAECSRQRNELLNKLKEQAQHDPVALDGGVMALAQSVGLIGPSSRTHDLHAAIQRFHDLITVNASIKAAQDFAIGLVQKVEQPAQQQELGVKGYAMALNEIALKLRQRYKTDLLSTPLWAEFEKARNKFATSIASPPAQRKPLPPEWIKDRVREAEETTEPDSDFACFEWLVRKVEAAHGIKENT